MITSRDINSTQEPQTRHMLIDVVGRHRLAYNQQLYNRGVDGNFEVEIPYPEEFVRSPNPKFVRVISTSIHIKPTYERIYNETTGVWDLNYEYEYNPTTQQQEPTKPRLKKPFYEESENTIWPFNHYILQDFPNDPRTSNDFETIDTINEHTHLAVAASFVQDSFNDDQIVGLSNPSLNYFPTYEQHTTERSFRVWILDCVKRNKISLTSFAGNLSSIILELELVY